MKLRLDIDSENEPESPAFPENRVLIHAPQLDFVQTGPDIGKAAEKLKAAIRDSVATLERMAGTTPSLLSAKGRERLERLRLLDEILERLR